MEENKLEKILKPHGRSPHLLGMYALSTLSVLEAAGCYYCNNEPMMGKAYLSLSALGYFAALISDTARTLYNSRLTKSKAVLENIKNGHK